MSGYTDEKLVYMANQIARNLAREDDPAAAVAAHIRTFWSPCMINGLLQQSTAPLDPIAALALAKLAAAAEIAGG
jgi:hypothetical protein